MSHSSPATNQGALLGDVISACNNCRTHEPRETQQSVGCRWLLSVRPWLYPTRGSGGGGASGSLRGAGAGAGRRLCRRGHSRRGVAAPNAAVRAWLLLAQPVPGAPRIVLRVTPGALPQGPARLSGAVLCAQRRVANRAGPGDRVQCFGDHICYGGCPQYLGRSRKVATSRPKILSPSSIVRSVHLPISP
jgi:hypothetical protein